MSLAPPYAPPDSVSAPQIAIMHNKSTMRFYLGSVSSDPRRSRFSQCLRGIGIGLWLVATPGLANSIQETNALLKQEKYAQALDAVEKYLAGKPKDAQGRFLKGIALTELKRYDAAASVFQKLTEDFPELPEPYNNLAVIYAQQKHYDKAKAALEMAIRTHPAYATAHENLGDIYARLASQAYDKALQLDSSNASAQNKLSMIQDLMVGKSGAEAGRTVSRPVAGAPVPATKPTQVAAAPTPAPAPSPTPASKPSAEPPKPAGAEKPTPVADKPPVIEKPSNEAVASAVSAWAAAWARKDVKSYLAAYARDFKTPGGIARGAWETERKQRIDKPGAISVEVKNLKVALDGERATATFRQIYQWNGQAKSANKRLDLARRDGQWLIVSETVGG